MLANLDSGTTGTYLRLENIKILRDMKSSAPAEGTLIRSTHHGYFNVLGHGAMLVHIFPQLRGSLVSISQLVDLGLHTSYCSSFVTFFDCDNKEVLQSNCDDWTGLLIVALRSLSTATASGTHHSASAAIKLESAADCVIFWHAGFNINIGD